MPAAYPHFLALPKECSRGGIAQLGERVLCKHEVVGSIPSASTKICFANFSGAIRIFVLFILGSSDPAGERAASTIFDALPIIFVLRLLVLADCGDRGQLLGRWIAAPLWGERK